MYLSNSIRELGRGIILKVPQGTFLLNHEISLSFFFFFFKSYWMTHFVSGNKIFLLSFSNPATTFDSTFP